MATFKKIFAFSVTTAIILTLSMASQAQTEKQFQMALVGFYNLENLFDTIDDPNKRDEEFLPDGQNRWNTEKYMTKLANMSEVIS